MSSLKDRQATLQNLSFALRHPDQWPDGFEWNYSDCNKCAMGLAHEVWPKQVKEPTTSSMMEVFGIKAAVASEIFTAAGRPFNSNAAVTADRIADLIDKLETV